MIDEAGIVSLNGRRGYAPWLVFLTPFECVEDCHLGVTAIGAEFERIFDVEILYMVDRRY